jgi:uncharacterized membrane protein
MAEELKKGTGLPKNTAAALSYFGFWVTGILFLILEKDEFVRFHAMQSIVVFGVLTVVLMFPLINFLLAMPAMLLGFILWLVLIYKAYQGEKFKLPWVGSFAEKQLGKMK